MARGMSIFSIAYISSALFEVPTGVISDLLGRKKTLLMGALCAVICMVFYASGNSYFDLLLGAIFQGLSRAFYSGNNDALLHDTLKQLRKENKYPEYLGRTSSMFQVALASASLFGGFMAEKSLKLVMWSSVVPQALSLLIATQIIEPSVNVKKPSSNIYKHLGEALSQFRANQKLKLLTVASVIRFSLGESAFFFRSVFINSLWPLWAVGIAQTLTNVFGALSFYFSGKIINKYKPLTVLSFGTISGKILNLTALFFPSVVSPALMAITSLNFGSMTVATNSLLQEQFTDKQRATMSSLSSFSGSIGFGVCSLLVGALADATSASFALIIISLLSITPLFFYKKISALDSEG